MLLQGHHQSDHVFPMKCILPNLLDLIKGKEVLYWTRVFTYETANSWDCSHDGDNNNYLYFVSLILMQSSEKVLKQGTQLLKLTLKY